MMNFFRLLIYEKQPKTKLSKQYQISRENETEII